MVRVVLTPDAPQHQFGVRRELYSAHQWQEQLDACGIDPSNLASQVFKPWESVSHSAHSSHRERSRGTGKAKREANVKENNNDLKVLDQAPAKAVTGCLQKVEILNARCSVGRIRQAAVAACCPFADQMTFPVIPVISACLSNALPTSASDDAFAFE